MACIRYRSCPLHSLPWQRSIFMSRVRLRALSTALACLLVAPACNQDGVGPRRDATLVLVADVSTTTVATVVVAVIAPDIPTPLVFNIPVVNGLAAGTIVVPAGFARPVAIQSYDPGGAGTDTRSRTLDPRRGPNPTGTHTLHALAP